MITQTLSVMRRHPVLVALGLWAGALLVAWAYFQPQVRYTVRQELVQADEAIVLVGEGAPLEEIKEAVRRSGKHVDGVFSRLGGSLLYYAVKAGRQDVVRWLIKEGANPNGISLELVPLARAIENQGIDMIKLLIACGADPDLDMGYDITPRDIAQTSGNAEILSALPPKAEVNKGDFR